MTPTQLAAYEALCAKVPSARHPEMKCKDGVWTGGDGDYGPMNGADALAILTLHLEAMLPKPWEVSVAERRTTYEQIPCGEWQGSDPDRFAAVCAAVEASH